jgi:cephalosporin-C deacetylase
MYGVQFEEGSDMPQFDFPLEKLKTYDPGEAAPRDFDAFWKATLAETATTGGVEPHFVQHPDTFYKHVDVYDVTFRGYKGQAVKGWFLEPRGGAQAEEKLPCVVTYVGYGGGRGLPLEHLLVPTAGFAHFVMDTRGQGSGWTVGDTPDVAPPEAMGPQFPGFMTRGIESRESYYYRRVFVDAVRAVEAAAAHPRVDASRIAVTGGSQGGGITLAAAALLGNKVKLAMPDVPFLCHFTRATRIIDSAPYSEIQNYLKAHRPKIERVYRTLSYFDGIHFSPRIKARTLMSIALMDPICPPSTCFAAYNRLKAKKELRIYDFNTHEGGGPFQMAERMRYAMRWL